MMTKERQIYECDVCGYASTDDDWDEDDELSNWSIVENGALDGGTHTMCGDCLARFYHAIDKD
jgi:hypothetical protein